MLREAGRAPEECIYIISGEIKAANQVIKRLTANMRASCGQASKLQDNAHARDPFPRGV